MMKKESSRKYSRNKGIGIFSNTLFLYLILLLGLITIYLVYPAKVLRASNFVNSQYLKSWKIKNGEIFSIEYIHSVEQSPVIENFLVDGKDIVLQDTYFHSYGAGLPSTTPYKSETTKDGFRVYDINLKIDNLIYRTSSEGRNHKVILRDKDYMLLDFSQHRMGVRFDIVHMTKIGYILKEGKYFER